MAVKKDSAGRLVYGGKNQGVDEAAAFERWPVQRGDLWGVGEHRLLCGDLEAGAGDYLLQELLGDRVGTVIVDPPWDSGNARTFRTKAAVDGPQGEAVDWQAFMARLARLSSMAGGDVWVEFGRKHTADLVRHMSERGLKLVDPTVEITYYRTNPCTWSLFSLDPSNSPGQREITSHAGLDDSQVIAPAIAASTKAGDVVIDWCTGRGLMAYEAASMGRVFLGTELAERRAAVTLGKLAQQSGHEPEPLEVGLPVGLPSGGAAD